MSFEFLANVYIYIYIYIYITSPFNSYMTDLPIKYQASDARHRTAEKNTFMAKNKNSQAYICEMVEAKLKKTL